MPAIRKENETKKRCGWATERVKKKCNEKRKEKQVLSEVRSRTKTIQGEKDADRGLKEKKAKELARKAMFVNRR